MSFSKVYHLGLGNQGSGWFRMVQDGLGWFRMVQDGSGWFRMVQDGLGMLELFSHRREDQVEFIKKRYEAMKATSERTHRASLVVCTSLHLPFHITACNRTRSF